ncbi:hypothetical protein BDU57DRAFT_551267 [Ampelomyces quisqualis]|uniref:Uncharacterized protein n=1 Tax=Ampelomyces quisqualis TaxID=50730 RepID=A0A6A5QC56_AMPQU|nr:hypothetical protein BDU57DRAFT_551267 [Ampelomyces quisqualis]
MAPTKRKAASTPKQEVKKGKDRTVKRPARGFHRFRSGMLNVTPKGGERDLVKSNQDSPLLRLPGELRNRIWEYVLGGRTLRPRLTPIPRSPEQLFQIAQELREPLLGFALLRTCRQVYMETALLPYKLNAYDFSSYITLKLHLRKGRRYQRAHIFDVNVWASLNCGLFLGPTKERAMFSQYKLDFLPALKRIHVLISEYQVPDAQIESFVIKLRTELEVLLPGRRIQLVFKARETETSEYEIRHSCTLS